MELTSIHNGWLIAVFFGLVGLCIGSFVNVVCYRLPIIRKLGEFSDGDKLREQIAKHGKFTLSVPRSTCPCCGARVKAWNNIPVLSWLLLRGTCASCASPIPIKYPAVELLFGVGFAGYIWFEGITAAGLVTLPMMAIGYCIASIRVQHGLILKPLAIVYVVALVLQMVLTSLGYSAYMP